MSAGKVPAYVLGVGMTKFVKPRGKVAYTELGFEAGVKALLDAHVTYDDVDQGVACYCYGDSTCGQRVFYQFGMTGIPIYNVNNNCSTGSTGLHMARQLVAHGAANCVLVVGFEQMQPGSFQTTFKDRPEPMGRIHEMVNKTSGLDQSGVIEIFGNAAREYISKYGATAADFAEVARLNHNHSQRNPYSQFTDSYSLEQILQSPMIYTPLTKLQCCPTSDGAAAVVVVSQQFLDARPHLKSQAILIAGQHLATDSPQLYSENPIDLTGYEMSKRAAKIALAEARVLPREIKVIELHDCFSANEICVLDALGISEPGKAHETVRAGDITYGGRFLVNPSGGLISKGHPLGKKALISVRLESLSVLITSRCYWSRAVCRTHMAATRLGQQ